MYGRPNRYVYLVTSEHQHSPTWKVSRTAVPAYNNKHSRLSVSSQRFHHLVNSSS